MKSPNNQSSFGKYGKMCFHEAFCICKYHVRVSCWSQTSRGRETFEKNCSLCISLERSPKRIATQISSSVNVASELPRRVSVSSRLWPDLRGLAFTSARSQRARELRRFTGVENLEREQEKQCSAFARKCLASINIRLNIQRYTLCFFVRLFNLHESLVRHARLSFYLQWTATKFFFQNGGVILFFLRASFSARNFSPHPRLEIHASMRLRSTRYIIVIV